MRMPHGTHEQSALFRFLKISIVPANEAVSNETKSKENERAACSKRNVSGHSSSLLRPHCRASDARLSTLLLRLAGTDQVRLIEQGGASGAAFCFLGVLEEGRMKKARLSAPCPNGWSPSRCARLCGCGAGAHHYRRPAPSSAARRECPTERPSRPAPDV